MGKYGMSIPEPITYRPVISGDFFPSRNEQPIITPYHPKRPMDHTSFSQHHPILDQHSRPSHASPITHVSTKPKTSSVPTHTLMHPSHSTPSPQTYKKASSTKHLPWLRFFTYQTILHPDYYENHTRQNVRFILKTGGLLGVAFCFYRVLTLGANIFDSFTLFGLVVLLILSSVLLFISEHFDLVIARENPYTVKEV